MASTQTNNQPKAKNKWLSEFADVTVEAADLEQLEEAAKPKNTNGEISCKEIFESSQGTGSVQEGEVVNGAVISVNSDFVTVDIGYKMEGLVPLDEFKDMDGKVSVKAGDHVVVYLE